jgi:prepilin-type N-terminal cleavage/methylation domain-containing protein
MVKRKAFTLIEIMIVVVIIGLLAIALFPKLMGAIGKTSDAARKIEISNWAAILTDYKSDKKQYPVSSGACLDESFVSQNNISVDANKMPKDPNPNNETKGCRGYFWYKSIPGSGIDNNSYVIAVKMENTSKGNYNDDPANIQDAESFSPSTTGGQYFVDIGLK